MSKTIVIALGGNAILQPGQKGTIEEQFQNIKDCCKHIIKLVKLGHKIVLTHGNGPQVGNILVQNEIAKDNVPSLPLSACSAKSQGLIGYMFEQTLKNEIRKNNLSNDVVTLLTQTIVDIEDPAFKEPTKPIGLFFSKEEALKIEKSYGYVMKEDAGRGYRRVVASPYPKRIEGVEQVKLLSNNNCIVISTGGGGIPVYTDKKGNIKGIDAVIDKDRSASKLAQLINADILIILTDVTNACINYGLINEEKLGKISTEKAQKYYDENHFSVGSMKPKIESAIEFAEKGKISIITSMEKVIDAVNDNGGTRIEG